MTEYQQEVTIKSTPERIFPYLVTPELLTQWIGGLEASTPLTTDGLRVGAKSRETIAENGRRFEIESEVRRLEMNQLLEASLSADSMACVSRYELEPRGGGTILKHCFQVDYIGFLPRLFAPLMRGSVLRKLREDLNRLRTLVETQ